MIKPTVGRIVWFMADNIPDCVPLAGVIAGVQSDLMVNLSLFDSQGNQYARPNVRLVQEDDDVPTGPYACWMPYQLEQAKKAAPHESAPHEPAPPPPFDTTKRAFMSAPSAPPSPAPVPSSARVFTPPSTFTPTNPPGPQIKKE